MPFEKPTEVVYEERVYQDQEARRVIERWPIKWPGPLEAQPPREYLISFSLSIQGIVLGKLTTLRVEAKDLMGAFAVFDFERQKHADQVSAALKRGREELAKAREKQEGQNGEAQSQG